MNFFSKKILPFVLSFLLLSGSAAAFDFYKNIEIFGDSASVENLYRNKCGPRDGTTDNLKSNYTPICEILRESETCKDVPEEDKIECIDFEEENSIELISFRALGLCAWGLLTALKDLFVFLKDAILGGLGYLTNSETRNKVNDAVGEYADSLMQYVALEYDKELDKGHGKARASINIAGTLLSDLFGKLSAAIQEEYYGLGCYRNGARIERVCKIIGDVTMPPAIALALIFKTKKILLNKAIHKRNNDNGALAPTTLREQRREVSEKEIQRPQTKEITEELLNKVKDTRNAGASARDVGSDLDLIVANNGSTPLIMFNSTFKNNGKRKTNVDAACNILTYKKCGYSYATSITVDYLDQAGLPKQRTLKGVSAISFQEKYYQIRARSLIDSDPDKIFESNALSGGKALSEDSKKEIANWLTALNADEMANFSKLENSLNKDLAAINDPSSLINSFKSLDGLENEEAVLRELLKLTDIRVRAGPTKERFKGVNKWIKSPEHALYLFDKLNGEDLNKNWDLIRYLTDQIEYFKRARPVRGSPKTYISYAFEKEGKGPEISLYYKDAKYSDEDWLQLPEEERIELLRKATPKLKDDVSYDKIAPTAFRPNYLGKYTEETHSATNKSYVWELKSKQYEIDQARITEQMRETAKLAGDAKGFHSHVVFEMPNNYKHFDDFGLWTKQVNDYLYLRGMEEGLHGGVETNIMRFAAEKAPRRKSSYNENIPESLASLERWSHKGFTMAVRGKIYGNSLAPNSKRVGLELRDISRDVDTFDQHMGKVSDAVADYRWENVPHSSIDRKDIGFLRPTKQDFKKLLTRLTDNPKVAEALSSAEAYGAIPLTPFEKLSYIDYKTGKLIKPDAAKRKAIIEARKNYIREIEKTVRNLEDMIKKGDSFEPEDLQMTIQMDLTEWAKKARVSELFTGL